MPITLEKEMMFGEPRVYRILNSLLAYKKKFEPSFLLLKIYFSTKLTCEICTPYSKLFEFHSNFKLY